MQTLRQRRSLIIWVMQKNARLPRWANAVYVKIIYKQVTPLA